MLTLVRRFLVVAALLFWMGGFTFYGAVVIPIGLREIGKLQAQVTGPVTFYLNLAGIAALLPFGWDLLRCRDPSPRRSATRWIAWTGMAATLACLFALHALLTHQVASGTSAGEPSFHLTHKAYLWIGTAQWVCGVLFTILSLAAWRSEDGRGERGASAP